MIKLLLFSFIGFVICACGQTSKTKPNYSNMDTSRVAEGNGTPDIKKLRQEYVQSYNKPLKFESFSKGRGKEKLIIIGKYYCLFDSAIIVPGKYNFDDTTKSFTTHNFAEDVVIISNGDTITKITITKKDFLGSLPQNLKDFAVIFEPKFEGYDSDSDTFDFDFNVSIPLTDIGQLMILSLKRNGNVTVKQFE